ncbi:hypothetical protein CDFC105_93417 [Clostridioides difficile]|nr:hypothetical protein [Clostridioides difficile]CZR74876.1 reductase [Clostridium difficile 630] [Clostridioides difficile]CZR89815.1 hypothetical protein CDFC105_13402 [Clostridioides difficile]CZS10634.1 hypothetical protein CDFC105_93417 [Clostridioides difficile]
MKIGLIDVDGTTVHDLEKRFSNEDIENERQISFFQTEKVSI